jgi:hypothetical protein
MDALETLTAVTTEQWDAIRAELEKLLKIKQKAGESLPDYAVRLAKAGIDPKKVSDDDWNTLDEDTTQKWLNGASIALEKGEQIALPPGSYDAATETSESAAAPPAKKSGGKKAPAAKKAAAEPPAKKAAATKALAKKAAKAPAKEKGRGRPTLFSENDVIKVNQATPFRAGTASATGYAKIKDGMTVKKAIAAGAPRRLIRWANICEYITVAPPSA